MRRTLTTSLVFLTLALLARVTFFRETSSHVDGIGTITHKWKWGLAREISVDVNDDGVQDFSGRMLGRSIYFSTHQAWRQYQESSKCDGFFDLFVLAATPDRPIEVNFDQNRDGKTDIHLTGKSAEHFLKNRKKEPGCEVNLPPELR